MHCLLAGLKACLCTQNMGSTSTNVCANWPAHAPMCGVCSREHLTTLPEQRLLGASHLLLQALKARCNSQQAVLHVSVSASSSTADWGCVYAAAVKLALLSTHPLQH